MAFVEGRCQVCLSTGQASEDGRDVYAWPVPELARAMGTTTSLRVKLIKACHGLVNAPAEWRKSVTQAMEEAGFQTLITEPCCWRLMDEVDGVSQVIGVCAAHVDDFLLTGDESNVKYRNALTYLYDKFTWTPWEEGRFEHCGVDLSKERDGSFVLDHSRFWSKLQQVDIEKGDRKEDDEASEVEKSQLRGLLGGIQWRVYQTAPQHAAQLSMLQTEMTKATVRTLREANKLCREVYQEKNTVMKISSLNEIDPAKVCFVAWSDAALGNRPNGGSAGGYLIATTTPDILEGKPCTLNVVSWKSFRLPRVARSSLAAEVQGSSEAEEELMFAVFNGQR